MISLDLSRNVLILAALSVPGFAQGDLEGRWGGWLHVGEEHVWFQLRASQDSLHLVDYNADMREQTARDLEVEGDQVRFVYDAAIGPVSFECRVDGASLTGKAEASGLDEVRVELVRLHEPGPDELEEHLGRYVTEDGRELWVVPRPFGGVRIAEQIGAGTRYSEFLFDGWLPIERDLYFVGFPDGAGGWTRTMRFDDGRLEIHGEDPLVAERNAGEVRRVRFASDEHTLHGWLMIPPGEGPHPAIAYAHGSGYVTASGPSGLFTAAQLARRLGLAVLRWDKQGVGDSTGDQRLATYHDLADDIDAAVAFLATQPDIDPRRIGVGGASQAPSWPIPIAAARNQDISFVIATVGSVATAAETNTFNWTNRVRAAGHSDEEAAAFRAFIEGAFPFALDDPMVARWRKIWNVDPRDHWSKVTCPVFQPWGADDPLVDSTLAFGRMTELIAETKQTNFTSIVYPSPTGHAVGISNASTFFGDLEKWFRSSVSARRLPEPGGPSGPSEDRSRR